MIPSETSNQARADRARAAQTALEALLPDLPPTPPGEGVHEVLAWCKREQERITEAGGS